MPRSTALTRIREPGIAPITLSPAQEREFATLLGIGPPLPDVANQTLAWLIALYRPACAMSAGHRAQRMATHLARIEKMLRGGGSIERYECALRTLTDPAFGQDYETWERLAPIASDPRVPASVLAQAVEARRREIDVSPRKPRRAVQAITAAYALLVWFIYAAGRQDKTRQWRFVLAVLAACDDEGKENPLAGFQSHPERLLRDLGKLPELTRAA